MFQSVLSTNALVPFTIINTRGFDLPQTGSYGNWMFPVVGLSLLALCITGIVILCKKRSAKKTIDNIGFIPYNDYGINPINRGKIYAGI